MPPPSAALRFPSSLIARAGAGRCYLCAQPARASPAAASTYALPTKSSLPPSTADIPTSTGAPRDLTPIWFNQSFPRLNSDPCRQDGERKIKLGKTLRVLQERLPTVLQSPLPQEILAPNISLHLFPSTHPYLPTVSGRVGYSAALWTSPIAWNQVPIVGNIKLDILSERMVSQPLHFSPHRSGAYGEQLLVKWRTAKGKGKIKGTTPSLAEQGERKLDDTLRGTASAGKNKGFTGLFIFEFDKDGKIISHTIEHVDQHGEWEKGVGAKVVGLTDWLLGGIKGRAPDGAGGALPMFELTGDSRKDNNFR